MYNSDGVLTFSTGAFATGVTVEQATYKMWAVDFGVKRTLHRGRSERLTGSVAIERFEQAGLTGVVLDE